jgi:hypothetical protein
MKFFTEVKAQVADFSGILAPIHYITWRHIQDDLDLKML